MGVGERGSEERRGCGAALVPLLAAQFWTGEGPSCWGWYGARGRGGGGGRGCKKWNEIAKMN